MEEHWEGESAKTLIVILRVFGLASAYNAKIRNRAPLQNAATATGPDLAPTKIVGNSDDYGMLAQTCSGTTIGPTHIHILVQFTRKRGPRTNI